MTLTGRSACYFILAAIFFAVAFGSLIQGIMLQVSWYLVPGYLETALAFYFVALIFGGITKMCIWEVKKGFCGMKPKRKR